MRVLHTSDWHLGRHLHRQDLLWAQERVLDDIVDKAGQLDVDAVLISGDIFDHTQPSAHITELLGDTLRRLGEITQVVLTDGNHDSARRLGFTAPLLRDGISICTDMSKIGKPVHLKDRNDQLGALVYPLPYLHPLKANYALATWIDDQGQEHPDIAATAVKQDMKAQEGSFPLYRLPATHDAVFGAALRRISADIASKEAAGFPKVPIIGMAHAFVTGAQPTQSECNISVGGIESVSAQTIANMGHKTLQCRPFTYLALGHLHRPQRIKIPGIEAAYSGSPLPFSFSEAHMKKSMRLVKFKDNKACVEEINLVRPYNLERLTASIVQIENGEFDRLANSWCEVTLNDTYRPEMAGERIRRHLPMLLRVRHMPTQDPESHLNLELGKNSSGVKNHNSETDPMDLTCEFWARMTGKDPSEQQKKLLNLLVEQARDSLLQDQAVLLSSRKKNTDESDNIDLESLEVQDL